MLDNYMPRRESISAHKYLLPIISTLFITYISFNPKELNKVPSIIKFLIKNDTELSYKDYIPSIPNNLSAIWELSQLEYDLKLIESSSNIPPNEKEEEINNIIKKAKEIIGDGKMSKEILHKFPEYLSDFNKAGVISKIKGIFSFVNFIWLIAILGIMISIGPVIYQIMGSIILTLYGAIIYPIVMFLYNTGLYIVIGYIISNLLICDGMRVNKEWGLYISLTGTGFLMGLFSYSLKLKDVLQSEIYEEKLSPAPFGILTTLLYFSLSIHFNSKLFSFFAVINLYTFLGFFTDCFGLCYVIGFKSKSDLYLVVMTSFVLMTFYIILRALNINNNILELYRCPIQILGALTYFLGLLIFSSEYSSFDKEFNYIKRQGIFIGSLLLALFCGNYYNLSSMTNTAYVFAVLYIMEKNVEIFSRLAGSLWILIFIISLFLWVCSLYLHKYPGIIVSIFVGS